MTDEKCPFCGPVINWPAELVVCDLASSTVVLSDDQCFRGWCLVIAKEHVVDLFDLPADARMALEADVGRVVRAIRELFAPDRMNYAVFGNVTSHLHWNLIPRYKDDGHWGAGPWPHDKKTLSGQEAALLAEKLRRKIEGTP